MMDSMKKMFMAVVACGAMLVKVSAAPSEGALTESSAEPERSRGVVARMELAAFNAVCCDVVATITIEQGDEYLVEARGPEHIIRLIEPVVDGEGRLTIESAKEYKVRKDNAVTLRIVTPTLDLVYNEGVGNMYLKGTVRSKRMTVKNEGVGNIRFDDLQCEVLQVTNEGVGNIELAGEATVRAVFKSDGVGNINAYDLVTPDLTANLNGVGSIDCHVTERFTCAANGVGSIRYRGDPKHTNIRRGGIGKVRRVR